MKETGPNCQSVACTKTMILSLKIEYETIKTLNTVSTKALLILNIETERT